MCCLTFQSLYLCFISCPAVLDREQWRSAWYQSTQKFTFVSLAEVTIPHLLVLWIYLKIFLLKDEEINTEGKLMN